jgi:uncharacterized protein
MAYIDTSVLVAYYCPEALSEAAQAEIRRARPPAISALTEVEFRSALARKVRIGELDEALAREVLSTFRLHRIEGVYRVVAIEARQYVMASEWIEAFRSPLRTLDALHLAAAFSNGLKLVTADRALAQSAKLFGVRYKLIG